MKLETGNGTRMKAALPERWTKLWREMAAPGKPLPIHHELEALYSQPHRHYHNLRHVAECLAEFDLARELARQSIAAELAIWFHDADYDTYTQAQDARCPFLD
jgi:predicted metal-dependent HD superfamily phosphohydrolase